jgi:hypothetical protein
MPGNWQCAISDAFCLLNLQESTAVFAYYLKNNRLIPSFLAEESISQRLLAGTLEADNSIMKTRKLIVPTLLLSLAVLPSMAGARPVIVVSPPAVTVQVPVPAVTVQVPALAVTVQTVPDSYVWDGTEYVGVVGSQFFYLGPGNVWLTLDGPRLARFHGWEHSHADWRTHAIRNDRFRKDAHGQNVPLHDNHDSHAIDHSHDAIDHSHDTDHH